ncbi:MAG: DUF3089 domain-containing protein [Flavobacterium sp.]|uniref:DUF3089 domain-containing protein n=1 Tax=Flavobacterium sp. TaxID=239 RepID=UPI0022BB49AF|nr:DUF3089 domain-containing protein [Flavobacterium sp.]MCZ8197590.1 DUF3089 domain-containing protein [Flavobacterium sp.]
MSNWAFHPNKTGTLLDGFNIDIAVIDKNLNTTTVIQNTNNSMINTGVDVFFVHPTVLENMGSFTEIETIPIANQNTFMVAASIRGQAGLLSKYGRMFAPRYRQATPPTFINNNSDATQAATLGIAYSDIKAAFLNYLENHNNGNKIIIASHSQGAYLAGFLLKDVFDSNPDLQQKLVVAVIAGIVSNYANPDLNTGGWWQNIPFCTQQNECGCVMSWRCYKEGQIPPAPINSHPCLNPIVVSNGWANSQIDLSENWTMQDSLYYTDESSSLENFIILRNNATYGGNAGYVAFDNLYQIRHYRASLNQVGFLVQHTPEISDLRPNYLLDEESNPTFSTLGYHQKDYNIYTWALLEQIDMKLNNCNTELSTAIVDSNFSIEIYPNPASDCVYIKNFKINEQISVIDIMGKVVFSGYLNEKGGISIELLKEGFYLIRTNSGIGKLVISN